MDMNKTNIQNTDRYFENPFQTKSDIVRLVSFMYAFLFHAISYENYHQNCLPVNQKSSSTKHAYAIYKDFCNCIKQQIQIKRINRVHSLHQSFVATAPTTGRA